MEDYKNSILKVVKEKLCMGCGACAGVCSSSAIEIVFDDNIGQFLPKIDIDSCTDCGVCQTVCPGSDIDFLKLEDEFLSGEGKEDFFLGKFRGIYTGHAVDKFTRTKAASGGITTQILKTLLAEGKIDGAWVVRPESENWKQPIRFLATTKQELESAFGSLYQPTTGLGDVFNYMKENPGRYAFVGLPCQIAALRKAQMKFKFLRERVYLAISLFCFGCISTNGTEAYLKWHGISSDEISGPIIYRCGSWPGSLRVTDRNGKEFLFPKGIGYKYRAAFSTYFYMLRCFSCVDGTGELADIACGDPWLPEFSDDREGSNLFIVRSQVGGEVLDLCLQRNEIECQPIEPSRAVKSQSGCIEQNMDVHGQEIVLKKFGRTPPVFQRRDTSTHRYGPQLRTRSKQFKRLLIGRKKWVWPYLPWIQLFNDYKRVYMSLLRRLLKL
ncbi:Coenzyme F420 hydrogenase/dehydrogenase, beta subunit C-terminal domain [bacterium]|nr:Coenzyme F420 hydrogenase/dehydrogenase, beta subunit C-terminal domain [bacterium]